MTETLCEIIVQLTDENLNLKVELAAEKQSVLTMKNEFDLKQQKYEKELKLARNHIKWLELQNELLNDDKDQLNKVKLKLNNLRSSHLFRIYVKLKMIWQMLRLKWKTQKKIIET